MTQPPNPSHKHHSNRMNRRSFISRGLLAGAGGLLGLNAVYAANFPAGMLPVGLAPDDDVVPGKSPNLVVLNNKPWNAETPPHLLDPDVTPTNVMFVRNNGIPPENIDPQGWTLTIDGEAAERPTTFTIEQLKSQFEHHTYHLTLECGGNGRAEFNPPAKGNQWSVGAVSCARWTGVRLKDVLQAAGIKSTAQYIGYYGADTHLSGDPDKVVISRGVPISKALEDEALIAWAVNDEDIPHMNGAPLRLVFGGWPASTSGKWLTRISIRDRVHDGPKMGGQSYRVPKNPVPPGSHVEDEDMAIIESMPVKSLVTHPKSGAMVKGLRTFEVRGHAWAGDLEVAAMHTSIDFGASWQPCKLDPPVNRLAWQRWKTTVQLPEDGYYEIWARATDSKGNMQPMVVPGWNPKGYLNNACHRIAVKRKS